MVVRWLCHFTIGTVGQVNIVNVEDQSYPGHAMPIFHGQSLHQQIVGCFSSRASTFPFIIIADADSATQGQVISHRFNMR